MSIGTVQCKANSHAKKENYLFHKLFFKGLNNKC